MKINFNDFISYTFSLFFLGSSRVGSNPVGAVFLLGMENFVVVV